MPTVKARYWIATLNASRNVFTPTLSDGVEYLKGQLELGSSGYLHWQFLVYTSGRLTLGQVKRLFPRDTHFEPTRSAAANEYVWKDDTCADIETRFELGRLPMHRNSSTDWNAVRDNARAGRYDDIPADILVRYYGNIKRLRVDSMVCPTRPTIECYLYWGEPGTGKTRRAFAEAGDNAYIKTPTTKWWDGYRGEENVIIDDFSGLIRAEYIKTWLDRYRCSVEIKGGAVPLCATKFWITSNHSIEKWYDNDIDQRAVRRRFTNIVHFSSDHPFIPIN
jgi:hypothetical protein